MKASKDEILASLEEVRTSKGDEAYYQARRSLALMLVGSEAGRVFLADAFPDLDLESVAQEAQKSKVSSDQDLFELMRLQVPNLKTQAQLKAYQVAFEALSYMANAYYGGDTETAEKAAYALDRAIEAIQEAANIAQRVEAIPEDQRSPDMEEMIAPPREPREIEEQRSLLAELEAITSSSDLTRWYGTNRKRLELVVSNPYRNELFDAIRAKQQALSN